MLGHDVMRAAERAGHELVLVDLPELDITDAVAVDVLLDRLMGEPAALDAVVNCAAWTDVDGAESKQDAAPRRQCRWSRCAGSRCGARRGADASHLDRLRLRRHSAARLRGASTALRRVRSVRSTLGIRLDQAGRREAGALRLSPPHGREDRLALWGRRAQLRGDDAASGRGARCGAGGERPDRLAHLVRAPCAPAILGLLEREVQRPRPPDR